MQSVPLLALPSLAAAGCGQGALQPAGRET